MEEGLESHFPLALLDLSKPTSSTTVSMWQYDPTAKNRAYFTDALNSQKMKQNPR